MKNNNKSSWFKRFVYRLKMRLTRRMWKEHYPTKEDWKRINEIDWKALEEQQCPTIDRSDHFPLPYVRSHTAISGIDVRFYIIDKENDTRKAVHEVQAFSYSWDPPHGGATGTILAIVFDKSIYPLLQGVKTCRLIAANEFGVQCCMDIEELIVTKLDSGISIDDLVSEEKFTFTAKNITPWYKVSDIPEVPC